MGGDATSPLPGGCLLGLPGGPRPSWRRGTFSRVLLGRPATSQELQQVMDTSGKPPEEWSNENIGTHRSSKKQKLSC
jgi:hypothetical protein